eukprot:5215355-Alexandrium_andersonii.AAC.1
MCEDLGKSTVHSGIEYVEQWSSDAAMKVSLATRPRPHTFHGISKQAKGSAYKGKAKGQAKGKAKAKKATREPKIKQE